MEKRTRRFTFAESELLLMLIANHRQAIENRNLDNESVVDKRKAWATVGLQFNANSGEPFRPLQILKTKYENLKATKKVDLESMAPKNLQGEPPEINCITANQEPFESEEILEQNDLIDDKSQVMADCLEVCLNSSYAQDNMVIGNATSLDTVIEGNKEVNEEGNEKVNEEVNPDNNVSESPVKRTANPRRRKITMRDKWGEVAAAKLRKTKLEIKFLMHENKLKIRKLNIEIGNLKREEEKYDLEIKLLKKQVQDALPPKAPRPRVKKRYPKA